jgi:hypothetical protein
MARGANPQITQVSPIVNGHGGPSEGAGSEEGNAEGLARLSGEDLRRLREAHLEAQHALLLGQLAQHRLATLALELEWRYGLLGADATIDVQTGRIAREAAGEGESRRVGTAREGTP